MTPPADNDVLIPLSPIDTAMGHIGLTAVYIFSPPGPTSPYDLDRVRASLVATIEEDYPSFVGELSTDAKTGAYVIRLAFKTRAAGAQAIPFELDRQSKLSTDEAMQRLPVSLLPARQDSELLTFKATLLRDGGLALGANLRHVLLDGEGFFTFMNVWGMHYRGLARADRIAINQDRRLLMPRGMGAKMPHPEYSDPSNIAGIETTRGKVPPFPPATQKVFHLTQLQLRSLKQTVSHQLPSGQYVSTIDVVTALFAVLITQARGHGKSVKLFSAVNGRTRFNPPLPPNYAGNCIVSGRSVHTPLEIADATVETVRRIALCIRASVLRCDDEYVRDAIEAIAPPGGRWRESPEAIECMFGPDLWFTSWANMGMYSADFGAGIPVCVAPPSMPLSDGIVVIMDAMNRANGLDVMPLLECSAMDRLTELWTMCELLHP